MVNKSTEWMFSQKKAHAIYLIVKKNNREPKVACMGISYKPDLDDLRESPALFIVNELIKSGYDLLVSIYTSPRDRESINKFTTSSKYLDSLIGGILCFKVFNSMNA